MTRAARWRRWQAPEVVQTSAMDCGPASLKCLLNGHGVPASYGRLRELCQTEVDGTSLDTLEETARLLGLDAEQRLVPFEHLVLPSARSLPAMAVVRKPDGSNHFVVIWRRVAGWFQLMDPAVGRRWIRTDRFGADLYRHQATVAARDWREWAASDGFTQPLAERLRELGCSARVAGQCVGQAQADAGWFGFGLLDASVRLTAALVAAGGLARGAAAQRMLLALIERTRASPDDIYRHVARDYWCVRPDPMSASVSELQLHYVGAVLLTVGGLRDSDPRPAGEAADTEDGSTTAVRAVLDDSGERPWRHVWRLLREDGLQAPALLCGAVGLATAALLFEALLFRGLFDLANWLVLPAQRALALAALAMFVALMLTVRLSVVTRTLDIGRHLDVQLRMALLEKLTRLDDRYFRSRPVSDMADRSHSLQLVRGLPGLALNGLQSVLELAFTLAGIAWLAPDALVPGLALAATAMLVPFIWQPALNELDARVRNQSSGLSGFYLDALTGLMPIRAHRAEHNVRRQHEALLTDWMRANLETIRVSLFGSGLQSLVCSALAAWLLYRHFEAHSAVTGADLLLIYWTLKLPAIGARVNALAHEYPAQRNIVGRLLEPLTAAGANESAAPPTQAGLSMPPGSAPSRPAATSSRPGAEMSGSLRVGRPYLLPGAASIRVRAGAVVVSGHTLLAGLDLAIEPGEHVAIVGPSGAGKSTLIGLLLGWQALASGRLEIDGLAADAASIERLRRDVAWVDPSVQIWNDSLLSNVVYASADERLARAAEVIEAARLRDVVRRLPEGLQTVLGESGSLLSGGEGQRLRLARALLIERPRLVLLDEPFRGLDRTSRGQLLGQARRWWSDATLLCATHDIEHSSGFDRVLVVDSGRVVEDAAPAALLASRSRYRGLLEAERALRDTHWADRRWKRLHVGTDLANAHEDRA